MEVGGSSPSLAPMNILKTKKPFNSLQPGDKLYILKPFTTDILETLVVKSQAHPKSKRGVWVLEVNKVILGVKGVTEEKLQFAKDAYGTKTTMTIFVQGSGHLNLVVIDPAPTVVATEKQYIEQWTKLTIRNMPDYLEMKKRFPST